MASVHYTWAQLAIVVTAGMPILAVYLLVNHTMLGTAMRAVAQDRVAATLLGINVDRVIAAVFFIGGAFAGAAAVMASLYYGQVSVLASQK